VNVPALGNVRLKVAPGAIVPEVQDPSSPTEVCASASLLIKLTVPPAEIVIGFGAYAVFVKLAARLTIDTGVPVALVPPDGEEGEYELHPIVRPITPARMLNRSVMLFSIRNGYRKRVAISDVRTAARLSRQTALAMLSLFPKN
jgi:hypothetical protein